MVEKVADIKEKANLQPPFGTRKIDSRCPKRYRLLVKKNKDDAYWEYRNEIFNKDKDKPKFHNSSFANQPQTQVVKEDMCDCWRDHLATGVNSTKIVKKDKDKTKDLSYIKCYICEQKDHYVNKCLKKSKN